MVRIQRPFELGLQPGKIDLLLDRSQARSCGVRVRSHGDELRIQLPREGRTDYPPQFRGRVEQRAGKPVLAGIIRESRGRARFTKYNAGLVVVGAIIVVIGVVTTIAYGWVGLETVAVGILAIAGGGALWRQFARTRGPIFERQAKELETSVRGYLYRSPD